MGKSRGFPIESGMTRKASGMTGERVGNDVEGVIAGLTGNPLDMGIKKMSCVTHVRHLI